MEENRSELHRRFGVEIEVNALDGRSKPLIDGTLPEGIHYVANVVFKASHERVVIHRWGHDHDNQTWVVKPDSSCGLEACSPVSKGWYGLKNICRVVEAFSEDPKIIADDRCSLHVHIDVSDLSIDQLASVISWWIKCEPVFMDSMPPVRKRSRYCQFLGLWETFNHDSVYSSEQLVKKLGTTKYGSLNTFHLKMGKRQTIEFRLMEAKCCKDPFAVKNWVRLLLRFVEMTAYRDSPLPYRGDPNTGFCWLDPLEVFNLLNFGQNSGMREVAGWFLGRLQENVRSPVGIILSENARKKAREQYFEIAKDYKLTV